MQTKHIPKLGITTSRLGFGAMRMPNTDGTVDYPEAEALVDYLHQHGVTYYDTAWFYHSGQSEPFLRRALVERYPRDSFTLATKLPLSQCKTPQDMRLIFDKQCENLGVDYIDFYLLHGIGLADWKAFQELGAPDFLRALREEGKIRFAGFSFHGENEELAPILDDFPWQFCQVQVNYADWYQRKAEELYRVLTEREIPIIVMEPVRGGGLANLYPDMAERLRALGPDASQASWAMRFCGSLPHVDVILSGMSTMAQCEDNVNTFSPFRPLNEEDGDALREVAESFDRQPLIPCTGCRYCADCPQGIDISKLFLAYNSYRQFQAAWPLRFEYLQATPAEHQATACVSCGQCESMCPQHISIIDELARVHEYVTDMVSSS